MSHMLKLLPLAACLSAPALACPPPIPGQTEAQRLKPAFDAATDIVYGVVLKGAREGQMATFRVLHVYKGNLRPGATLKAKPSYGFDPPSCLGMMQVGPPFVTKGQFGVVALDRQRPFLEFMNRNVLDLAFDQGWIRSAQR